MTKTCKCGHNKLEHNSPTGFCCGDNFKCPCKKFVAEDEKFFKERGIILEKPQKSCGKFIKKEDRRCGNKYGYHKDEKRHYVKEKTYFDIWLCPSCSGNHSPEELAYPVKSDSLSTRGKEPDENLKSEEGENPSVSSGSDFDLSKKIRRWMDYKEKMIDVKDVKTFIKIGDKIFYAEDYADDKVPHYMFIYAQRKWDKLKKFVGKKLSGR